MTRVSHPPERPAVSSESVSTPSFCVIIPAYNEAGTIEHVVKKALAQAPDVVVIDDGSTDDTAARVEAQGARVIRHSTNKGKGASLLSGFMYARENGYAMVVTMDADGQHDPGEIPHFLEAYKRTRIPVLIGNRMWSPDNMPLARRWTNRFMSWLLSRIMRTYLADTQCGFRLYRTDMLPYVRTESQRFAMESEILLFFAMRGFRMDSVRITSIYDKGKSRINPVTDTVRFFAMVMRYLRMRKG